LAVDRDEWETSCFSYFTHVESPQYPLNRKLVDYMAILDAFEKRGIGLVKVRVVS
jgi:hypothetical protein